MAATLCVAPAHAAGDDGRAMSSPAFGLYDPAIGLYDPANEHDACGVAFVADLAGGRSHDVVANALTALRNLEHRGATGREIDTGDGAGLLTQIPDAFFRAVGEAVDASS